MSRWARGSKASTQSNTSSVSQKKVGQTARTGDSLQMKIMQLQREYGNRATMGLLQRKTASGTAQLMGGLEEEELQMKVDPSAAQLMGGLEEEELQLKAEKPVQRSSAPNKMPTEVQAKMESALNADFSDVNIHVGSQASDVGALAYAQGNDVHFAQGKFDPHSQSGQELLGHELAHVVQQRQGRVQPTTSVGGLPVNDDPKLEQEADDLGRKAAQTKMKEIE